MASYGSGIPTLTPRISELYGASGGAFRVGEADSYTQDLDELEHGERAFENTIQELVNRRAAVPIGVKFHREGAASTMQKEAVDGFRHSEARQDVEGPFMTSGSSAEEGDEEEEEEEDMDMMDEDEEEDEETTGRATIVRGEGQQREEEFSDDSFVRELEAGDDSMDMDDLPLPSA